MPIQVFYSDAIVVDAQSYSPSAHKPAEVVRSWQCLGVAREIVASGAVTIEQFCCAPDAQFVTDVLDRKNRGALDMEELREYFRLFDREPLLDELVREAKRSARRDASAGPDEARETSGGRYQARCRARGRRGRSRQP